MLLTIIWLVLSPGVFCQRRAAVNFHLTTARSLYMRIAPSGSQEALSPRSALDHSITTQNTNEENVLHIHRNTTIVPSSGVPSGNISGLDEHAHHKDLREGWNHFPLQYPNETKPLHHYPSRTLVRPPISNLRRGTAETLPDTNSSTGVDGPRLIRPDHLNTSTLPQPHVHHTTVIEGLLTGDNKSASRDMLIPSSDNKQNPVEATISGMGNSENKFETSDNKSKDHHHDHSGTSASNHTGRHTGIHHAIPYGRSPTKKCDKSHSHHHGRMDGGRHGAHSEHTVPEDGHRSTVGGENAPKYGRGHISSNDHKHGTHSSDKFNGRAFDTESGRYNPKDSEISRPQDDRYGGPSEDHHHSNRDQKQNRQRNNEYDGRDRFRDDERRRSWEEGRYDRDRGRDEERRRPLAGDRFGGAHDDRYSTKDDERPLSDDDRYFSRGQDRNSPRNDRNDETRRDDQYTHRDERKPINFEFDRDRYDRHRSRNDDESGINPTHISRDRYLPRDDTYRSPGRGRPRYDDEDRYYRNRDDRYLSSGGDRYYDEHRYDRDRDDRYISRGEAKHDDKDRDTRYRPEDEDKIDGYGRYNRNRDDRYRSRGDHRSYSNDSRQDRPKDDRYRSRDEDRADDGYVSRGDRRSYGDDYDDKYDRRGEERYRPRYDDGSDDRNYSRREADADRSAYDERTRLRYNDRNRGDIPSRDLGPEPDTKYFDDDRNTRHNNRDYSRGISDNTNRNSETRLDANPLPHEGRRTPGRSQMDHNHRFGAGSLRDYAEDGESRYSRNHGRTEDSGHSIRTDSTSADGKEDHHRRPALSAKDVLDAALRLSEDSEESADTKAVYPIFNPKISNMTSSDVIRPSERRGVLITARRK